MKKYRAILAFGNFLMLSAVCTWMYSSQRYNAMNVGGETGDVGFWMGIGDIGYYVSIMMWPICFFTALGFMWKGKLKSKAEGVFFGLFSLLSAPLLILVWPPV